MKFAIAIVAAVTISGTAMAHQLPQSRPYAVGHATNTYQVHRSNGRVAQCEVVNHFQPGRGMVRTRSCWRIR